VASAWRGRTPLPRPLHERRGRGLDGSAESPPPAVEHPAGAEEACRACCTSASHPLAAPRQQLARNYGGAVKRAVPETGLAFDVLPIRCPFAVEQILDAEFLPA
jgi:hypothetical protein